MTDGNKLELSRRKVLGGIGTIGIASAGAGLGTSAYFSDEETFKNNTLTAGSLDLKVDWEEHYSDWSDDEMVTYTVEDGDGEQQMPGVKMELDDSDDPLMWTAMPDTQSPFLYVHENALDDFMAATAIEAYPDDGDNGSQSLHRYSKDRYCDILADTPQDLNPDRSDPARTLNDDTIDENGNPKSLVSLGDVKPGDFGELTLSFHLCDNPGYVWMTGQLASASENGVVEPEGSDTDEMPNKVELLDAIQTMLWYDENGNNVYEPGGETGAADIALVLDESGSMGGGALGDAQAAAKNLIDSVGANAQISVVGFEDEARMVQTLTSNKTAAKNAVDQLSSGGSTNIEEAIDMAHEEVDGHDVHPTYSASGNDRDDADSIIVLLTDGSPNVDVDYDDDSTTTPFEAEFGEADPSDNADFATQNPPHVNEIYTIGFGGVTPGSDEAALLEYMATDPSKAFIGAQDELFEIFSQIAQQLSGEECFFRGSLRELLNLLSGRNANGRKLSESQDGYTAPGIPLDGDRSSLFDEIDESVTPRRPANGNHENRDEFVDATLNNIGLAWWLPVDHGNEVQTDSVQFDIGFYAEQSRHNEGGGMGGLIPTRTGEGWVKQEVNFNGTATESAFGRGRFGDNDEGTDAPYEVAVGDDPNSSGGYTGVGYGWTSGETVPWTFSYDASNDEATFTVDGSTAGPRSLPDQPDGRIGIQTKADEATISVDNVTLTMDGQQAHLSGPNNVTASNDDAGGGNGSDGRDLQYLVMNTDLDGETSFTVSGDVTVTIQGDYDGSDEGVAFDVVVE
jgi:predicted ribosomally synthesized peptide with SipW-like signal peptide